MKNILIFGLAIAGIMFSSSVFAGDVTMKTTYWHDLTKDKKTSYTISTDTVRAGEKSQKFELLPGSCGRDRYGSDCEINAERVERIFKQDQKPGKEYWYAWSIMLDPSTDWSKVAVTSIALGQVKALGVDKPPWIFKMRNNQFYTNIHFAGESPAGKIAKGDGTYCGDMGSTQMATGKWMDILLKADYSDKLKQGHSYLQIWINGELVCDIKDTIVNKHTWSDRYSNKGKYLNFRYGIYNNDVDRAWDMPIRTVWYDEIRIGSSREDVELNIDNPVD